MIWVGMPHSRFRLGSNWGDEERKELSCVTLEEEKVKLLQNLYIKYHNFWNIFGLDYPTK